MKKIAVPVDDGRLASHFGHCRQFSFFEVENGEVVKHYQESPPPHTPGAIPNWLVEVQTTDLIAGGIGPKAIEILKKANIEVLNNIEPADAKTVVNDFLKGTLVSGANHCHHHE